jgi:pyruvate/2-oxoglutarate dehydrogenase complex dihydrolipoamide acyltransferase (E2) component
MREVRLPDLGEVDDVIVVAWLKQEGDSVAAGEALVEVETEKTTFVIEAPEAGRLAHIVRRENEKVCVHDLLAQVE